MAQNLHSYPPKVLVEYYFKMSFSTPKCLLFFKENKKKKRREKEEEEEEKEAVCLSATFWLRTELFSTLFSALCCPALSLSLFFLFLFFLLFLPFLSSSIISSSEKRKEEKPVQPQSTGVHHISATFHAGFFFPLSKEIREVSTHLLHLGRDRWDHLWLELG